MKEIAHQSRMSATPTRVAASVGLSVPCRSNSPTRKSRMMCSTLKNMVARPTQSQIGSRQSRPDHSKRAWAVVAGPGRSVAVGRLRESERCTAGG
jgi:hypothetical protein